MSLRQFYEWKSNRTRLCCAGTVIVKPRPEFLRRLCWVLELHKKRHVKQNIFWILPYMSHNFSKINMFQKPEHKAMYTYPWHNNSGVFTPFHLF